MSEDLLDRDKVKALRAELGLSLDQAAKAAGMTGGKGQWHKLELGASGGITLATLAKIAKALECAPRDLLIDPRESKKKGKK